MSAHVFYSGQFGFGKIRPGTLTSMRSILKQRTYLMRVAACSMALSMQLQIAICHLSNEIGRREQQARGSSHPISHFGPIVGQESRSVAQRSGPAAAIARISPKACTALDLLHWHFESARRWCTWPSRFCVAVPQGRVHTCMHCHARDQGWQSKLCTERPHNLKSIALAQKTDDHLQAKKNSQWSPSHDTKQT